MESSPIISLHVEDSRIRTGTITLAKRILLLAGIEPAIYSVRNVRFCCKGVILTTRRKQPAMVFGMKGILNIYTIDGMIGVRLDNPNA